jgi:PAS domain S-box-containing protein
MVMDSDQLLKENETLTLERDELLIRFKEANEIIEAIKKGNIDAIVISNNHTAKILTDRNADNSYRRFIENMSEGVVTLHSNGVILFCNVSFANMVNLPLEKVTGTNFRIYIPDEYLESFELFFTIFRENNSKIEIYFRNPAGARTYLSVSLNKLQFLNSVALNLVCTDISEKKLAEEKLISVNEDLQKAMTERIISENKVLQLNSRLKANIKILESSNDELSRLAHIASRDLQEPLRKIMTYSSMLIHEYNDIINHEGQRYISSMQNASERVKTLINNIVEYSSFSDKDFLFRTTNLQSVISEVLSDLTNVIKETQATITIESQLPEIQADAGQIKQLFYNIFTNSLKFIKVGVLPIISLSCKIVKGVEIDKMDESKFTEEFCIIDILDNGIGFDSMHKSKIFIIFQRLNSSSYYKGSGMGLAICKKIVEQHNGFITAESEINKGALFTITLPVRQNYKMNNGTQK